MLSVMLVRKHLNVFSMGNLLITTNLLGQTHLGTCTVEKLYECDQCGKFFRSSSSLVIHGRVHTLGRNCMNAVAVGRHSSGAVT